MTNIPCSLVGSAKSGGNFLLLYDCDVFLLGRPAKRRFALALLLSALAGASSIILLGLSGWFLTAAAVAGSAGAGYVFNHLYPSAGVRAAAFSRVLTKYGEQLIGHDATLSLSAHCLWPHHK